MAYIVTLLNQLPFALPSWMPPWAALLIGVLAVLYALLFLAMPFNVFGVKGRIDALEGQIEQLNDEVRMLTMRAAGIIPREDPRGLQFRAAREESERPARPRAELPEFERLKNAQRAAPPEPNYPPRRTDRQPPPRGRAEPRLD